MRAPSAPRPRLVRGAAYATASVILAVAVGCGTDHAFEATSAAHLTAAVLTEEDMPKDYLPAENAEVFQGMKATSQACRQLLALADVRDIRDAPRADAAFYQFEPGGSVAEHVLQVTPARARSYVSRAREAGQACRRITMRTRQYTIKLSQRPKRMREIGEESYAVRFAGRAGDRHHFHLDLVLAQEADRLLVVANLALMKPGQDRILVIKIAERALDKLRLAATATPLPE